MKLTALFLHLSTGVLLGTTYLAACADDATPIKFVLGATGGKDASARQKITGDTTRLLAARNFKALESNYQKFTQGSRTPSGMWELSAFYDTLANQSQLKRDPAYWRTRLALAAAWRKQFPQSVAARLFEVDINLQRTKAYRGTTDFAAVSAADRAEVMQASSAAMKLLEESKAHAAKARDPRWYQAMLGVLPYTSEFSQVTMKRFLDEGRALYPAYHGIYETAAFYAEPRWHGAPDADDQIAREASNLAGDEQPSMYARIYRYLDQNYYHGKIFEVSHADWPTLRTSFAHLARQYPDAWNLNAYGYYACLAKDYGTMHDVVQRPGFEPLEQVWGDGGLTIYDKCMKHGVDPAFESRQAAARIERLKRNFYEYINFGIRLREERDYEGSLESLHKAEDIDRELWRGNSMMPQFHLGMTYFKMQKYDDAVKAFTTGLQSQPDYAEAYWRRGLAFEALGRNDAAQEDFRVGARYLTKALQTIDRKRDTGNLAVIREMQETFKQHGFETPAL